MPKQSPWGFIIGDKTKCETQAGHLFEVCEQLAYAYQTAIGRYTTTAMTHVDLALNHLLEAGIDVEDLSVITEPLNAISRDMNSASMASHIYDAQEELKRLAPRWIRVCRD